jgi:RNA polymerase sigma factor (sigma-70 family)
MSPTRADQVRLPRDQSHNLDEDHDTIIGDLDPYQELQDLIDRAFEGRSGPDCKELMRLADRHITRFLVRKGQDLELVKEISQEVLTAFISACQNGKCIGRWEAWISKVSLRRVSDHLRKGIRDRRRMPTVRMPGADRHPSGREADPTERLAREEERASVRDLVEELPPTQKLVVRLRYFNGLSYRQISELMGISVGTVGSDLSNAIGLLRELALRAGLGPEH